MKEKKIVRINYLVSKCRKENIDISDVDLKYYRSRKGVWSEKEYDEKIQTLEKKILLNKLSKYKEVL